MTETTKIKAFNKILDYGLKNDFRSFLQKSFNHINPNTEYLPNWHINYMAELLMAVTNGEVKRLIINVPPRSLKSVTISVAWPAWLLGYDPSRRIIACSYAQTLSNRHSIDTRLIMQSDWYKRIFTETEIKKGENQKSKFTTTKRGFRFATSVGGTLTGEGGDFLILDDPHNPAHINFPVKRQNTIDWFEQSFVSRLNDKKEGVIVLVMQRLHENDLTGYLLQNKMWEHVSIPAIAKKETVIALPNKEIITVRQEGEYLHPEREGKEELERAKIEFGSLAFAAQYMQNPISKDSAIIKRNWIKRYDHIPKGIIVQSWDTAIKATAHNDYTVCTTWVETEEGYYLIDVLREKYEYLDLKKAFCNMAEQWKPNLILVEDKASGQVLLQEMTKNTKLPIVPIKPLKDKMTRFAAISGFFEAEKIYFPKNAIWLPDLEQELMAFPLSSHDDQVDSISQYLNHARTKVINDMKIQCLY